MSELLPKKKSDPVIRYVAACTVHPGEQVGFPSNDLHMVVFKPVRSLSFNGARVALESDDSHVVLVMPAFALVAVLET